MKCDYVLKSDKECSRQGKKYYDDNDNADEEWLCVAEFAPGVKFSSCMFIDQDIVTCCILRVEEMRDDANNEDKTEDPEEKNGI